jgi:hypothetical protein
MTQVLIYDCPSCTASCSVSPELVGLNVVCPNCTQEFSATHPESAADLQLPDAIPFFKSGKLEILKNHLNKLTSDGELSKSDEIALTRAALMLGLKEKDFVLPRYFQWSHARGSLLTVRPAGRTLQRVKVPSRPDKGNCIAARQGCPP